MGNNEKCKNTCQRASEGRQYFNVDAFVFTQLKIRDHVVPRQPMNVVRVIGSQMRPQCIVGVFTPVLSCPLVISDRGYDQV